MKPARVFGFWLGLVLLTGCGPADPLQEKVAAETVEHLTGWRGSMRDRLSPEQWKEFEASLQDIKFQIIANRDASGTADVNTALCERIDGHTVIEVLRKGAEAKIALLDRKRSDLEYFIQQNTTLRTRPGDTASENYLLQRQAEQVGQLEAAEREITAARARLAQLTPSAKSTQTTKNAEPTDGPPVLLGPRR
jgi:hypothetical protein